MSNNDLQALFATLRSKSNSSSTVSRSQSREPSGNFPSASQIPSTPPPPFSPVTSDVTIDESKGNPAAQNLLNLLNFGANRETNGAAGIRPSETSTSKQQTSKEPENPAPDLVKRLFSPSANEEPWGKQEGMENDGPRSSTSEKEQPQINPLLELLNRQKPGNGKPRGEQGTSPIPLGGPREQRSESLEIPTRSIETPTKQDATSSGESQLRKEEENQAKPMFTYTNPFDALKASRPQTPKTSTPKPVPVNLAQIEEQSIDLDDHGSPQIDLDPTTNQRRKLTPRSRLTRKLSPQAPGMQESDSSLLRSPAGDSPVEQDNIDTGQQQHDMAQHNISEPNDEPAVMAENHGNGAPNASPEWEDIQPSPSPPLISRVVPVYNFPIKAFLSITLQLSRAAEVGIREDSVMEISRIKKDFDQTDRSLAVATSKFICYALVKHGGMRIIRQDDGRDRHVFKHSNDRIFNVSVCIGSPNTPSAEDQAILGTGVSGAVYYATLCSDGIDLVDQNAVENASLIFPAYPQSDENTAGGILKTRAKRSSRHPEFFAIGRGKVINIIWPSTAMSARYGVNENERHVDVEKLFRERTLQISTGKAGKDFVFSEDDTMIVSLDKTGRLRFWDIRKLVEEENATSARMTPVVVDTPLLSLMTASPAERSWPTSVLFIDKARPYKKGGPLRYVLVGLRQNHTLQLWDIALGKAVQEINFPHETEVDGICSVNYHPGSGIIVVSHPTRNSIFFVHLSAPRYTLSSSLTQASYVQRVAAKDPEIPKPESTACMSGIRELAFTGRGTLRSVELLSVQKAVESSKDETENDALFELYVVHSKGVTCLAINKEDLGWDAESKVIESINAEKENLVSLKELKLGSIIDENSLEKTVSREESQAPPQSAKSSKKKSKKSKENADESVQRATEPIAEPDSNQRVEIMDSSRVDGNNTDMIGTKDSKKSKKKSGQNHEQIASQIEQSRDISAQNQELHIPSEIKSNPATSTKTNTNENRSDTVSMSISGDWLNKELKKLEQSVATEFRKEFEVLFQNIQKDRSFQDQSSAARQEAVLRLVSNSLNTNVEKSLTKILATQMHEIVVPSVVQSVSSQMSDSVARQLSGSLPRELSAIIPMAIGSTLRDGHTTRLISEAIVSKLNLQIRQLIVDVVNENLTVATTKIANEAAQKATKNIETNLSNQIKQMRLQHEADRQQIHDMNKALESMALTLKTMSEAQISFQNEVLKAQGLPASKTKTSHQSKDKDRLKSTEEVVSPVQVQTKEEKELDEVRKLMYQRKFEEGSIKWLQSSQPVQLFDSLFVNFTPEYLSTDVSPLVAFSIAVTVASAMQTNTERRLEWIAAAFEAIDFNDREIIELSQHAPQLVHSMIQKLESLYIARAEQNDRDLILQAILPVVKKARELRSKFQEVNTRRTG